MTSFSNYLTFLTDTKDDVSDILTYTTQCVTGIQQFLRQLDRMELSDEAKEEYLKEFMTDIEDAYEASLTASEDDVGNALKGYESLATISTWGTHGDMVQNIKKLIDLLPDYGLSSTTKVSTVVYKNK